MSEELDKLSSLGVQKIYDDTRIPVHHIQALFHNSFDGLSKVQFLGFISILEREYNVNLKTLKQAGLEYFDEKDERNPTDSLFVVSVNKKSKAPLYITITIIMFSIVVAFNYFILNQESLPQNRVDNRLIKNVQENIIASKQSTLQDSIDEQNATIIDDNITINNTFDLNLSKNNEEKPTINAMQKESFKIVPRSKVWFGYIDVQTNEKHQMTLDSEINLDPNKEWLLLFGHGYVDMFIGGDIQKFNSRNKTRFLYENQTLKAISSIEFQELNRGLKW